MKWTLKLENCKPFSINNAYYKKSFTHTKECRQWRKTIIEALSTPENLYAMEALRDTFKVGGNHALNVTIIYGVHKEWFWTQKGDISRRSQDLSNVEKLLIDIIFDSRFYERGEIENLNIDDKYITVLHSEKTWSNTWNIEVTLSLVDLKRYK